MPYRVTIADPEVDVDLDTFVRAMANWAKSRGVTTDAQRAVAVAAITAGSAAELQAIQAILNSVSFKP